MKKGGSAVILALLIFFQAAVVYLWIQKDYYYAYPEKFYLMRMAQEGYFMLNEVIPKGLEETIKSVFNFVMFSGDWRARLFQIYSAFFVFIFNDPVKSFLISNIPFLALALVFTYKLARQMLSPKGGLLAAGILSFYPGFFGISRCYTNDFPLIGISAAVLYCLIRTEVFCRTRWVLLFSATFALAVLINARAVVFIAGPLGYYLIKYFQRRGSSWIRKMAKVAVASALFLLITFPWLTASFKFLKADFCMSANISGHKSGLFSFALLPWEILNEISLVYGIVLMWFFISLRRIRIKYKNELLLFLIPPFLIFPFISSEFNRYYFPVFIGFAVFSAAALEKISGRMRGKNVIIAVMAVSLAQLVFLSFDILSSPKWARLLFMSRSHWVYPPRVNDRALAAEKFLPKIKELKKSGFSNPGIALFARPSDMNGGVPEFFYYASTGEFMVDKFFFFPREQRWNGVKAFIVIADKVPGGIIPQKPRIGYVKTEDYRDFWASSYPDTVFSSRDMDEICGFIEGLEVIDTYRGTRKDYYLCLNRDYKDRSENKK